MDLSKLDDIPDIISNNDKTNLGERSEIDLAAFAASWLLERGYPVLHTDLHSLQHDFLKKNYPTEEDNDNTEFNL